MSKQGKQRRIEGAMNKRMFSPRHGEGADPSKSSNLAPCAYSVNTPEWHSLPLLSTCLPIRTLCFPNSVPSDSDPGLLFITLVVPFFRSEPLLVHYVQPLGLFTRFLPSSIPDSSS